MDGSVRGGKRLGTPEWRPVPHILIGGMGCQKYNLGKFKFSEDAIAKVPFDRYNEYGSQSTLSEVESFFEGQKRAMMKNYRVHVNNVIRVVPREQLLVWNIKDGWEPVCRFLGRAVPNKPFPFENATGDKSKKNDFIEKYIFESDIMVEGQNIFKWNCTVYIACPLMLTGCCYIYMN